MPPTPPSWITTEATVTTCVYQTDALRSMAFGFSTRNKFRITFDYYAHGRLYSGTLDSPTAVPQNDRIPLAYNPLAPAENTYAQESASSGPTRSPLIAFGIAGSVILSLAWLLILRGCNPH